MAMRFNARGRWLACSGVGGVRGDRLHSRSLLLSLVPLEGKCTHTSAPPRVKKGKKKKGLQGDTIIKSKHIFFLRWQLLLAALSMTHSYIGEGFSVT